MKKTRSPKVWVLVNSIDGSSIFKDRDGNVVNFETAGEAEDFRLNYELRSFKVTEENIDDRRE